jgi:hypothetical protein
VNDVLPERTGSQHDVATLSATFQGLKFKHYKGTVHQDLTSKQLRNLIRDFVASKEAASAKCLVFIIMSHGDDRGVICVDGIPLPIQWIMDKFSIKNAPILSGKPKYLTFQCCRYVNFYTFYLSCGLLTKLRASGIGMTILMCFFEHFLECENEH